MDIKEFGQLLYVLRKAKNKTVAKAAAGMVIDTSTLDQLERGTLRRFPSTLKIEKISTYYDVVFYLVPEQIVFLGKTIEQVEIEGIGITYMCKNDFPSLKEMEKRYIIAALNKTDWNREKAARLLKLPIRTLHRRLNKYNIGEKEDSGKEKDTFKRDFT